MFAAKHILHLFVAETGSDVNHPVGEVNQHLAGEFATCVEIGITQSGISFVYIIKRHPFAVKVETSGTDIACFNFFPELETSRSSSDKSCADSLLCTV